MTNRDIIIFASGLIVGAGSGILATMNYFKKKYSDIADQQIAEMEEYYGRSDNYIRRDTRVIEDEADEVNPVNEDGEPDRAKGILDQDARDEIKKKLLDNYARSSEMATNYAQISKELFEQKRAELEHPEDDEEEPITETPEEIADYEHKQNFNKPPRIISLEEYNSLPGNIDTQTLYYYMYDSVLTDDDENEIPDPETLIGDSLVKYGFDEDDDEMLIFVMNYQLDTAYEIQKVKGAFSDN